MDINDDDDDDLPNKIKHFLTKHTNFRDPAFDPAPYLIKVLKEKQANQELLVEKQTELIQLQNEAQELIEEVTIDRCQDFMQLLSVPQEYGQQLQGLKQNMANVKRKVKETKALLLQTQKDIQQIHLNCVFNKLVYRKLKEVELKLNQYQTASLALKNHLYLDCAQNLPSFSGNSVLQGALAARSQNLKLRFLHQAIEEVRLFLYFTPRLTLPTVQMFFDRVEDRQEIFNEVLHAPFHRRYQLFKKAQCEQYLSSIWSLEGLEEKTGRVAVVNDIVKGIIRIGKSSQITESLILDVRKSVANVYQVLAYFFSKDLPAERPNRQKCWFTSADPTPHKCFLSVLFCVGAALLRKMVIVRKICGEYQLDEVTRKLSAQIVLEMLRDEIVQLVRLAYFPQNIPIGQVEAYSEELRNKLKQDRGFIYWPYFRMLIQNSFQILCQQLLNIQEKIFSLTLKDSQYYIKAFQPFHQKFLTLFHQQFMKEMEVVFPQGRGFNPQSLDSILSQREYASVDIEFCSKYCSQQRKSIREYFQLISLLNSLKSYFSSNNFEPLRFKQYSVLLFAFFYLKLNYTLYRYIISPTQFDKAIDARTKDAKLKNKEKHTISLFENIVKPREQGKPRTQKKYFKNQEGDHPQMRSIEQLKMIRSQTDMLLFYSSQSAASIQEIKISAEVDRYETEVEKHEPSNYDENVNSKLLRVWEQLIRPQEATQNSLDALLCAIYRRLVDLYFTVSACLYIETGTY